MFNVAGVEGVCRYLQEEEMRVEEEVKDGLRRRSEGFLSLAKRRILIAFMAVLILSYALEITCAARFTHRLQPCHTVPLSPQLPCTPHYAPPF